MNELKIAKNLINHYNETKKQYNDLISIAIKITDNDFENCDFENLIKILKNKGFNSKIESSDNKEYFTYQPL